MFIGATASGLFDVFETPFSRGKMPGIQVHAAVTDDVLSQTVHCAGFHVHSGADGGGCRDRRWD